MVLGSEKIKSKKQGINRLLPFINKHIFMLIIAVFCAILEVVIDLGFAETIKRTVDNAMGKRREEVLFYLTIILVIAVMELLIKYFITYSSGRFSESCLFDIRKKTFKDIKALPLEYLDKHPSGDIVSRVSSDLSIVQGFLQGTLRDLVGVPLRFIVSLLFLFFLNWKLTLFSLVMTPFLIMLTMYVNKPIQKHTKAQQEELGKVNSLAQDSISGIAVTKAFNLEEVMNKKYEEAVDKSVSKSMKVAFFSSISSPISTCLQMLPFILIFVYGGYLGVKGEMSFGSLVSFIQVMNFVVNPLSNMPKILNNLRSAAAATSRIAELWDETKERADGEVFEAEGDMAISFENVGFSYDGSKEILKDLSFNIKEGERVALVGYSGCGKSTVLKLIAGFYELNQGKIKIYGHYMEAWNLSKLRRLMAIVTQDNYLFTDNIYKNISYGKENSTMKEVIEASDAANIREFIEELPDMYHTEIGERGVKLSGGQKQRIAIGRAILKNAPILLLDEATSALDAESEKEVQVALEELMKGKTTLIVAHRLSTIINADRIIVMDEGKVVEEGSHEELLKVGKLYKQLYSKQFEKSA
jgi:ABC-type multidrug transport system fused ATPase/permease subunit